MVCLNLCSPQPILTGMYIASKMCGFHETHVIIHCRRLETRSIAAQQQPLLVIKTLSSVVHRRRKTLLYQFSHAESRTSGSIVASPELHSVTINIIQCVYTSAQTMQVPIREYLDTIGIFYFVYPPSRCKRTRLFPRSNTYIGFFILINVIDGAAIIETEW